VRKGEEESEKWEERHKRLEKDKKDKKKMKKVMRIAGEWKNKYIFWFVWIVYIFLLHTITTTMRCAIVYNDRSPRVIIASVHYNEIQ
jgi:hypothetical protein